MKNKDMQKILLKRSTENGIPDLEFGEPAFRTLRMGRLELMSGDAEGRVQVVNRPLIPTPNVEVYGSLFSLAFGTPMSKVDYQHVIEFRIRIPAIDKVFLEYSPFIELRMLNSVKKRKIVSPANYGGCVLGFRNREQGDSEIPQVTQVLIPEEFMSPQHDVRYISFKFNPHLYFGALDTGGFSFPMLKTDFEAEGQLTRNRRQIGSGSAFSQQRRYFRKAGGVISLPNRGKQLVVGFRIACLEPGTKDRLIYGDDSLFYAIKPELCKQTDSKQDYYYKWTVLQA